MTEVALLVIELVNRRFWHGGGKHLRRCFEDVVERDPSLLPILLLPVVTL